MMNYLFFCILKNICIPTSVQVTDVLCGTYACTVYLASYLQEPVDLSRCQPEN
jgi:hypothetical protein